MKLDYLLNASLMILVTTSTIAAIQVMTQIAIVIK